MRTLSAFRQIFIRLSAAVVFVFAFGGLQAALAKQSNDYPYYYYSVGDTQSDVVLPSPATPSLIMLGGGNFVVIRASNYDKYNSYIYDKIGGVSSVETIVIPSRAAAHDSFVIDRIKRAEALFIAGGDQSDYVNYWQGTPVQAAIQELANRNVPIAGKSAGMAIMGQYLFTASNGGITSSVALADPFNSLITLGRDFLALPFMGSLITDTHFYERDRMGRFITFMARIVSDRWTQMVRGIAVDEGTALVIDNGVASLMRDKKTGSVYFLQTVGMPEMYSGLPLTYASVNVQRLSVDSGTFNLSKWTSIHTFGYSISVINGVLHSTQAGGEIY